MVVDARIGITQNAIDDLALSGLTPQDIAARALGPAELAATGVTTDRVIDGYVIPYFDLHGDIVPYYRIKNLDPHAPDKYRAMKDMPNHIYFPPALPKLLAQPHQNYIIITEGEKKAACATRYGFPTVGLSGVDNWRNRQITFPDNTQFKAIKNRGVIQAKIPSGDSNALVSHDTGVVAVGFMDLVDYMVVNDMEAIIIYDTDGIGVKTEVQRAAAVLGYELRYRGLPISSIRQLILPGAKGTKVGLDDYIVGAGVKAFAGLLRNCRRKRIAFPRHPNPKTFVAGRLQKSKLSRKETQDVALSILMELETRGRRLRNTNTHEMHYFSQRTHTLMEVHLNNQKVLLHDTPFGVHLYREFNLAAIDQRVVGWLAAQFHGEPGVEEAVTHKVFCRPPEMPDCLAYQLSDSHFVIITPNPGKPYIIAQNGEYGVLFEQGHVKPLDHTSMETDLEEWLDRDDVLWAEVMEGFDFTPTIPSGAAELMKEDVSKEQLLKEGRMLAVLLYYMSPWLLRWRGTQLPVEMVIGEPGSGKSSLYTLRQTVITGVPRLSNMTNDIKDWYAGITSHGGLHILDNVHFTGASKDYQQRLSDELCRLVTEPDPHIELRKLYTTSDIVSLPVNTTFALTAIEQPFFTTDLIQRSAIFELQAISTGHNARWMEDQMDRAGGRSGWVAHQLATLHKFLKRAAGGEWSNDFKATHRLANYEQALTLMAKVLGLPYEWIPRALQRATATKMSDTDWTLAGLAEFVTAFKQKDNYVRERFSAKDVTMWAEGHEVYHKNATLTNGWKLGKYFRSHRGSLQKNLSMHENGSHANKIMYSIMED
jgi:hypothetical protein